MNLHQFSEEIASTAKEFKEQESSVDTLQICCRLKQALESFIQASKANFEELHNGLQKCLSVYIDIRKDVGPVEENLDNLGHYIFMECARMVLGVEFQKLDDDDETRLAIKASAGNAYQELTGFPLVGHFFLVLQWLMINSWSHPTLVAMMASEDLEEERAMTYLRSGEYPEIFRLRIEMLVEGGVDQFALNLCTWCAKSPTFQDDMYVRKMQLVLLHKLEKGNDLLNRCWEVGCCKGVEIIRSMIADEDQTLPKLQLAQTFLLQDWAKPKNYCCTEQLLQMWLTLQRKEEPDSQQFLNSVFKVMMVAKNAKQLIILATAMVNLFQSEFMQFCSEVCVRAMKKERYNLDSSRLMKDDDETDAAADNLARLCLQISVVFEQHLEMHVSSLLTTLYLQPSIKTFFQVDYVLEEHPEIIEREEDSDDETNLLAPDGVDQETYAELHDLVTTLRPASFQLRMGREDLREHAIRVMEESGFVYNPTENSFTVPEEPKDISIAVPARIQEESELPLLPVATIPSHLSKSVQSDAMPSTVPGEDENGSSSVEGTAEVPNGSEQMDAPEGVIQQEAAEPLVNGDVPEIEKLAITERTDLKVEEISKLHIQDDMDAEECNDAVSNSSLSQAKSTADVSSHSQLSPSCQGNFQDSFLSYIKQASSDSEGKDTLEIVDAPKKPTTAQGQGDALRNKLNKLLTTTCSKKKVLDKTDSQSSTGSDSASKLSQETVVCGKEETTSCAAASEKGGHDVACENENSEVASEHKDQVVVSGKAVNGLTFEQGDHDLASEKDEMLKSKGSIPQEEDEEARDSSPESAVLEEGETTVPVSPESYDGKPEGNQAEEVFTDQKQPGMSISGFRCQFCEKSFDSMAKRRRHQEWVCAKKSMINEPICELCGEHFHNDASLRKHMMSIHRSHESTQELLSQVKFPEGVKVRDCAVTLKQLGQDVIDRLTPKKKKKKKSSRHGSHRNLRIKSSRRPSRSGQTAVGYYKEWSDSDTNEGGYSDGDSSDSDSDSSAESQSDSENGGDSSDSASDMGQGNFQCCYCGKRFQTSLDSLSHTSSCIKGPAGELLYCNRCKTQFKSAKEIKYHICGKKQNSVAKKKLSQYSTPRSKPRNSGRHPSYKPSRAAASLVTYLCAIMYKLQQVAAKCIQCNQVFMSLDDCINHQKKVKHLGEGVKSITGFQCILCEEAFGTPKLCRTHMIERCISNIFNEEDTSLVRGKFWRCRFCQYGFTRAASMYIHIALRHRDLLVPLQCIRGRPAFLKTEKNAMADPDYGVMLSEEGHEQRYMLDEKFLFSEDLSIREQLEDTLTAANFPHGHGVIINLLPTSVDPVIDEGRCQTDSEGDSGDEEEDMVMQSPGYKPSAFINKTARNSKTYGASTPAQQISKEDMYVRQKINDVLTGLNEGDLPDTANTGKKPLGKPTAEKKIVGKKIVYKDVAMTQMKKLTCDRCGCPKKNKSAIRAHIRKHCEGATFTATSQFACDDCEQVFPTRVACSQHWEKNCGTGKTLECLKCGTTFRKRSYITRHIKRMHPEVSVDQIPIYIQVWTAPSLDDKRMFNITTAKFECTVCTQQFRKRPYVRDHIARVHKDLLEEEWEKHLKEIPDKLYSCAICSQSFVSETLVVEHFMQHHTPSRQTDQKQKHQMSCVLCHEELATIIDATDHFETLHPNINLTNIRKYMKVENVCPENNRFQTKLGQANGYGMAYKCTLCSREFTQSYYAKMHLRKLHPELSAEQKTAVICQIQSQSESSDGKIPCILCRARLSNHVNLANHVKFAHNIEEGKRSCFVMGPHGLPGSLSKFQSLHFNNFKCGACSQRFLSMEELEEHLEHKHNMSSYYDKRKMINVLRQAESEDIAWNQYQCALCEWTGNSKPSALEHLVSHAVRRNRAVCIIEPLNVSEKACLSQSQEEIDGSRIKYCCTVCNTEDGSKASILQHVKEAHPEVTDPEGKVFKRTIPLAGSQRVQASKVKYQCLVCNAQVVTKFSAMRHMTGRHPSVKQPMEMMRVVLSEVASPSLAVGTPSDSGIMYRCLLCQDRAMGKDTAMKHIEEHHPEIENAYDRAKNIVCDVKVSNSQANQATRYCCTICKTQLQSQDLAIKHVQERHPGVVDPYYKVSKIVLDFEQALGFDKTTPLNTHIRYCCDVCRKQFRSQTSTAKHIQESHTNIHNVLEKVSTVVLGAVYVCKLCQRNYSSPINAVNHMQEKHRGLDLSRPKQYYSCVKSDGTVIDLEGGSLPSPAPIVQQPEAKPSATVETTSHLPYSCNICRGGFANIDNIVSHLLKAHPNMVNPDDLKQYYTKRASMHHFTCNKCQSVFTQASSVTLHIQKLHPELDMTRPLDHYTKHSRDSAGFRDNSVISTPSQPMSVEEDPVVNRPKPQFLDQSYSTQAMSVEESPADTEFLEPSYPGQPMNMEDPLAGRPKPQFMESSVPSQPMIVEDPLADGSGLHWEDVPDTLAAVQSQDKSQSGSDGGKLTERYVCNICNNDYSCRGNVYKHIHKEHKDIDISTPEKRDMHCTKKNLEKIMTTWELMPNPVPHNSPLRNSPKATRFVCKVCQSSYSQTMGAERHIRKAHPEIEDSRVKMSYEAKLMAQLEQPLTPGKDGKIGGIRPLTPVAAAKLQSPMKGIVALPSTAEAKQSKPESIQGKTVRYECNICKYSFAKGTDIAIHISTKHPEVNINELNKAFTEKIYEHKKEVSKDEGGDSNSTVYRFVCKVCHVDYSQTSLITDHILKEHSTVDLKDISQHYTKEACTLRGGQYCCNLCNNVYTTCSNVCYHIRKSHSETALGSPRDYYTKKPTGNNLETPKAIVADAVPDSSAPVATRLPHTPDGPVLQQKRYMCNLCEKSYTKSNAMTMHIRKVHPEADVTNFKKYYTKTHTPAPNNSSFEQANHSGPASVPQLQALKDHMDVEVKPIEGDTIAEPPKQKPMYKCNHCETVKAHTVEIVAHIKEAHPNVEMYIPEKVYTKILRVATAETMVNNGPQRYQCNYCTMDFHTAGLVGKHITKSHKEVDMLASKVHFKIVTRRFKCNFCTASYTRPECTIRHIRGSHKEVPLDHQYTKVEGVPNVSVTSNTNPQLVKRLECNVCHVQYVKAESVLKHIRNTHPEVDPSLHNSSYTKVYEDPKEIPYQCKRCRSLYARKHDIIRHIQQHHGEVDPAKVEECITRKDRVGQSAELKQVKEAKLMAETKQGTEVKQSTEAKYTCKLCGHTAPHSQEMVTHFHHSHPNVEVNKVSNYYTNAKTEKIVCKVCGSVQPSIATVIAHINSAHAEKDRSSITSLYKYQRVRTEKRGKCKTCGKQYDSLNSVRSHIKSKHKELDLTDLQKHYVILPPLEKDVKHLPSNTGEAQADLKLSYACILCKEFYNKEADIKSHVEQMHTALARAKSVRACYQILYLHSTPKRGIVAQGDNASQHLDPQPSSTSVEKTTPVSSEAETIEFLFTCILCNKEFHSKNEIISHIRVFHDQVPIRDFKQCFHRTRLHSKQDHSKPFVQPQVPMDVPPDQDAPEKPFECLKCSSLFAVRRYLIDHLNKAHSMDGMANRALDQFIRDTRTEEQKQRAKEAKAAIKRAAHLPETKLTVSPTAQHKVSPSSLSPGSIATVVLTPQTSTSSIAQAATWKSSVTPNSHTQVPLVSSATSAWTTSTGVYSGTGHNSAVASGDLFKKINNNLQPQSSSTQWVETSLPSSYQPAVQSTFVGSSQNSGSAQQTYPTSASQLLHGVNTILASTQAFTSSTPRHQSSQYIQTPTTVTQTYPGYLDEATAASRSIYEDLTKVKANQEQKLSEYYGHPPVQTSYAPRLASSCQGVEAQVQSRMQCYPVVSSTVSSPVAQVQTVASNVVFAPVETLFPAQAVAVSNAQPLTVLQHQQAAQTPVGQVATDVAQFPTIANISSMRNPSAMHTLVTIIGPNTVSVSQQDLTTARPPAAGGGSMVLADTNQSHLIMAAEPVHVQLASPSAQPVQVIQTQNTLTPVPAPASYGTNTVTGVDEFGHQYIQFLPDVNKTTEEQKRQLQDWQMKLVQKLKKNMQGGSSHTPILPKPPRNETPQYGISSGYTMNAGAHSTMSSTLPASPMIYDPRQTLIGQSGVSYAHLSAQVLPGNMGNLLHNPPTTNTHPSGVQKASTVCSACGFKSTTAEWLKYHQKMTCPNTCKDCEAVFPSDVECIRHACLVHKRLPSSAKDWDKLESPTAATTGAHQSPGHNYGKSQNCPSSKRSGCEAISSVGGVATSDKPTSTARPAQLDGPQCLMSVCPHPNSSQSCSPGKQVAPSVTKAHDPVLKPVDGHDHVCPPTSPTTPPPVVQQATWEDGHTASPKEASRSPQASSVATLSELPARSAASDVVPCRNNPGVGGEATYTLENYTVTPPIDHEDCPYPEDLSQIPLSSLRPSSALALDEGAAGVVGTEGASVVTACEALPPDTPYAAFDDIEIPSQISVGGVPVEKADAETQVSNPEESEDDLIQEVVLLDVHRMSPQTPRSRTPTPQLHPTTSTTTGASPMTDTVNEAPDSCATKNEASDDHPTDPKECAADSSSDARIEEGSSKKDEVEPQDTETNAKLKGVTPEGVLKDDSLCCKLCAVMIRFRSAEEFSEHLKEVHGDDSDMENSNFRMLCPLCRDGTIFGTEIDFKCHMKWMHHVNWDKPKQLGRLSSSDTNSSDGSPACSPSTNQILISQENSKELTGDKTPDIVIQKKSTPNPEVCVVASSNEIARNATRKCDSPKKLRKCSLRNTPERLSKRAMLRAQASALHVNISLKRRQTQTSAKPGTPTKSIEVGGHKKWSMRNLATRRASLASRASVLLFKSKETVRNKGSKKGPLERRLYTKRQLANLRNQTRVDLERKQRYWCRQGSPQLVRSEKLVGQVKKRLHKDRDDPLNHTELPKVQCIEIEEKVLSVEVEEAKDIICFENPPTRTLRSSRMISPSSSCTSVSSTAGNKECELVESENSKMEANGINQGGRGLKNARLTTSSPVDDVLSSNTTSRSQENNHLGLEKPAVKSKQARSRKSNQFRVPSPLTLKDQTRLTADSKPKAKKAEVSQESTKPVTPKFDSALPKMTVYYFCNICPGVFAFKENMTDHLLKTHPKKVDMTADDLCGYYTKRAPKYSFKCSVCQGMFTQASSVTTHIRNYHKDVDMTVPVHHYTKHAREFPSSDESSASSTPTHAGSVAVSETNRPETQIPEQPSVKSRSRRSSSLQSRSSSQDVHDRTVDEQDDPIDNEGELQARALRSSRKTSLSNLSQVVNQTEKKEMDKNEMDKKKGGSSLGIDCNVHSGVLPPSRRSTRLRTPSPNRAHSSLESTVNNAEGDHSMDLSEGKEAGKMPITTKILPKADKVEDIRSSRKKFNQEDSSSDVQSVSECKTRHMKRTTSRHKVPIVKAPSVGKESPVAPDSSKKPPVELSRNQSKSSVSPEPKSKLNSTVRQRRSSSRSRRSISPDRTEDKKPDSGVNLRSSRCSRSSSIEPVGNIIQSKDDGKSAVASRKASMNSQMTDVTTLKVEDVTIPGIRPISRKIKDIEPSRRTRSDHEDTESGSGSGLLPEKKPTTPGSRKRSSAKSSNKDQDNHKKARYSSSGKVDSKDKAKMTTKRQSTKGMEAKGNDKTSNIVDEAVAKEDKISTDKDKTSTIEDKTSAIENKESALGDNASTNANEESTIMNKESTIGNEASTTCDEEPTIVSKGSTAMDLESSIMEKESAANGKQCSIADKEATTITSKMAITLNKGATTTDEDIIPVEKESITMGKESIVVDKESITIDEIATSAMDTEFNAVGKEGITRSRESTGKRATTKLRETIAANKEATSEEKQSGLKGVTTKGKESTSKSKMPRTSFKGTTPVKGHTFGKGSTSRTKASATPRGRPSATTKTKESTPVSKAATTKCKASASIGKVATTKGKTPTTHSKGATARSKESTSPSKASTTGKGATTKGKESTTPGKATTTSRGISTKGKEPSIPDKGTTIGKGATTKGKESTTPVKIASSRAKECTDTVKRPATKMKGTTRRSSNRCLPNGKAAETRKQSVNIGLQNEAQPIAEMAQVKDDGGVEETIVTLASSSSLQPPAKNRFKCGVCGAGFMLRAAYNQHVERHTRSVGKHIPRTYNRITMPTGASVISCEDNNKTVYYCSEKQGQKDPEENIPVVKPKTFSLPHRLAIAKQSNLHQSGKAAGGIVSRRHSSGGSAPKAANAGEVEDKITPRLLPREKGASTETMSKLFESPNISLQKCDTEQPNDNVEGESAEVERPSWKRPQNSFSKGSDSWMRVMKGNDCNVRTYAGKCKSVKTYSTGQGESVKVYSPATPPKNSKASRVGQQDNESATNWHSTTPPAEVSSEDEEDNEVIFNNKGVQLTDVSSWVDTPKRPVAALVENEASSVSAPKKPCSLMVDVEAGKVGSAMITDQASETDEGAMISFGPPSSSAISTKNKSSRTRTLSNSSSISNVSAASARSTRSSLAGRMPLAREVSPVRHRFSFSKEQSAVDDAGESAMKTVTEKTDSIPKLPDTGVAIMQDASTENASGIHEANKSNANLPGFNSCIRIAGKNTFPPAKPHTRGETEAEKKRNSIVLRNARQVPKSKKDVRGTRSSEDKRRHSFQSKPLLRKTAERGQKADTRKRKSSYRESVQTKRKR